MHNSVNQPMNEAAVFHHEKQNKKSSSINIKPDNGTANKLLNKNKSGN